MYSHKTAQMKMFVNVLNIYTQKIFFSTIFMHRHKNWLEYNVIPSEVLSVRPFVSASIIRSAQ